MIRALSTAATGMEAQQNSLDVTANNIANVSTTGFKKSRAEFQDLMYETVRAPGAVTGDGTRAPTGTQIGMGVRTVATVRMHTAGSPQQTGRSLDVAIEGNGFLGVKLPNGQIGYTRDGALNLDAEGKLVNSDGFPLTSEVTIPPEAKEVTIAADGTVQVTLPTSTTPVEAGKIQLSNFANPAGLRAAGRNLYSETVASGTPIEGKPGDPGFGTLTQNQLEGSNVNIVQEMIDLIRGQRAYEVNSRVVKAADEMLQQTAALR